MSSSEGTVESSSDESDTGEEWLAGASTLNEATLQAHAVLAALQGHTWAEDDPTAELGSTLEAVPRCVESLLLRTADLRQECELEEEELDECRATRTMLEVELLELKHRLAQKAKGEMSAQLKSAKEEAEALREAQQAGRVQLEALRAQKQQLTQANADMAERISQGAKQACQRSASYKLIRVLVPDLDSEPVPPVREELFGRSVMCRYVFHQPAPDQDLYDTIPLDELQHKAQAQAEHMEHTVRALEQAVHDGCVSWKVPPRDAFCQKLGTNPWTKAKQLEPLHVMCERVTPSANAKKEGTSELVLVAADSVVQQAKQEAEAIYRISLACEGCVSYKSPMHFNREEPRPLRCTYTREQGNGLKNKWFRVDGAVLADWAEQQADEIAEVLAALCHPLVLRRCQGYELPCNKGAFFQPIGEELQFAFRYKNAALQELCPPCAVSTNTFLCWANKLIKPQSP
eukprot:TRINITY_DN13579_c0_g1_i1.p1 TRINITY_DN13579_c0_g1~~TRINITY_DN13579_c0_g1_i1.p1  ORF type:complete len:460 (+),score=162.82 TRINITY_DN13579_c0_g1_i1:154-1533(+)